MSPNGIDTSIASAEGYDIPEYDGGTSPEELKSAVLDKLEAMDATGAQTGVAMYILDKLMAGELGEDAMSALEGGMPPGIEEADSPEELLAALMEAIGFGPSVLEGLNSPDGSISAGNGSGGGSQGTTGNPPGSEQGDDVLENDVVDRFLVDGGLWSANNQGTTNIVSSSNVDTNIGNGFSSSNSTSQSNSDTVM